MFIAFAIPLVAIGLIIFIAAMVATIVALRWAPQVGAVMAAASVVAWQSGHPVIAAMCAAVVVGLAILVR